MNRPTLSFPLRRTGASMRRVRRTTRFALVCEPLETRQLLSLGQTGFAAGMLASSSVASPQVSVPATVSNVNPSSYLNIEIEIGTFGGLNQIEIIFFGGGPVFTPTPTVSPGSGGLSPGSLGGGTGTTGIGSTGTGTGTVGTLFPSSPTTTSTSVTPLNPNVTSITNTPGGPPVSLVPPPLAPLAIHLGSSSSPATTQSNSTLISNMDEQPPSVTHFGQGDVFGGARLFTERLSVPSPSTSLIDFVEPHRPAGVPVEVPQAQPVRPGDQAPAPDAENARPLPPVSDPNIDAALDLTDGRVLTRSRDGDDSSGHDDQFSETNTSWSFSAIFGAAAVAVGGYHLTMREADRFKGRSIPRWLGAERPTKRKSNIPPR